jgi:hypothetical protein
MLTTVKLTLEPGHDPQRREMDLRELLSPDRELECEQEGDMDDPTRQVVRCDGCNCLGSVEP